MVSCFKLNSRNDNTIYPCTIVQFPFSTTSVKCVTDENSEWAIAGHVV